MDWAGLMHVGLYGLRLSPDVFWALTPAELQAMLGTKPGQTPMDRGRLEQLARSFPDVRKDEIDG